MRRFNLPFNPPKNHPEHSDYSDLDQMFMERAIELARKAEAYNEVPVGAVIVREGKIIGEGFNQTISLHDATAHAEILALKAAGQYLKNYRLPETTLYVTLEPCAMCAMAMIHGRVDRIVFGADDHKTGAAGSVFSLLPNALHNHQPEVLSGLYRTECASVLSAFFKRRRQEKKQLKLAQANEQK